MAGLKGPVVPGSVQAFSSRTCSRASSPGCNTRTCSVVCSSRAGYWDCSRVCSYGPIRGSIVHGPVHSPVCGSVHGPVRCTVVRLPVTVHLLGVE